MIAHKLFQALLKFLKDQYLTLLMVWPLLTSSYSIAVIILALKLVSINDSADIFIATLCDCRNPRDLYWKKSMQILSGCVRKVVVQKGEIMYISLLESLNMTTSSLIWSSHWTNSATQCLWEWAGICPAAVRSTCSVWSMWDDSTERKYVIEKEMLAVINFISSSMDTITVETVHKPLISISQKPIHSAPKRLHRMLLQMQRYEFNIMY